MADSAAVDDVFGCVHYKRKCGFLCPCCERTYTCRFCHNEGESHVLDRTRVTQVVCLVCKTQQEVGRTCISCGVIFGNYFCAKCRLYDDEDKKQFHCESCGICRVGGREKFFHCKICDICLPIKIKNTHKCIERASQSNCPVCLEDLHTSRVPSHVPLCGHLIHRTCFEDMIRNSNYACPLCSVSMVDMSHVWAHLDEELASTPMPPEYVGRRVGILCRDCHKESMTTFHVVGLKCTLCGSYNTCRANGISEPPPPPQSTQNAGSESQPQPINAESLSTAVTNGTFPSHHQSI